MVLPSGSMSLECPQVPGTEEAKHACGQIKSPNVQDPINRRLIHLFNHSVLRLILGNAQSVGSY